MHGEVDRCDKEVDRCDKEADRCDKEVDRCDKEVDRCDKEADRCHEEVDRCDEEADRCDKEADRCDKEICLLSNRTASQPVTNYVTNPEAGPVCQYVRTWLGWLSWGRARRRQAVTGSIKSRCKTKVVTGEGPAFLRP
ncbi:LOW QUALITY PROTEIN: membrane-bound O-acyltransferase domain-containing protein 2-like isoform X1 [Elysia marginata]|uniref:Membrane-bound O-acyltransferase domain-containing protein 2-like isoform X1 n=1 Tax=Elysia marginata TaxID=1093978 RepID=A0AAV4EJG8_9GAST|nr:LOW QUALITY PROTEIN: membrane-bound O-acyltransferase domain-containing protein 2-like isoform X1 [Elysia marginata]